MLLLYVRALYIIIYFYIKMLQLLIYDNHNIYFKKNKAFFVYCKIERIITYCVNITAGILNVLEVVKSQQLR